MNGGVFACAGRDEKDGRATDGGEEGKDSTNGAIRKKTQGVKLRKRRSEFYYARIF